MGGLTRKVRPIMFWEMASRCQVRGATVTEVSLALRRRFSQFDRFFARTRTTTGARRGLLCASASTGRKTLALCGLPAASLLFAPSTLLSPSSLLFRIPCVCGITFPYLNMFYKTHAYGLIALPQAQRPEGLSAAARCKVEISATRSRFCAPEWHRRSGLCLSGGEMKRWSDLAEMGRDGVALRRKNTHSSGERRAEGHAH